MSINRKQRKYLASFAQKNVSQFRPHRVGEVMGRENLWRSVAEHCLIAGVFADILAEKTRLPKERRSMLCHAAILHDWGKRREVERLELEVQKGTRLFLPVIKQQKSLDRTILLNLGISDAVISLSEENFPESKKGPLTLEGQILWYVDASLFHTEPLTPEERLSHTRSGWNGETYNNARAQFMALFNEECRQIYEDITFFEVQSNLAGVIGTQLSHLLGLSNRKEIPKFLKQCFAERVNA